MKGPIVPHAGPGRRTTPVDADARGAYSRAVADALELTLRTGLRSGEVCRLQFDDFPVRDGVLWADLPADRMKMQKAHSVPFLGRAREIVEARMVDGATFLFPGRGGDAPIEQKVLGVETYAHSGRSTSARLRAPSPLPDRLRQRRVRRQCRVVGRTACAARRAPCCGPGMPA